MEKFRKILLWLLFPHIAVVIILVPIATALLIYAFLSPEANPVAVYGSYFLSAYALTVVCTKAPAICRKAASIKNENRYVTQYMNDAHLRIKLSLYGAVIFNTVYALLQLGLGIHHHSVWFYALAGYYALLIIMRFFLLKDMLKNTLGERRLKELYRYRFCGVILLVMTQALAVIVFYIVRQNRGFQYHYIMTIAMAAYTFTSLTLAIVNVVRYRKFESPVMSAAKAISLTSAAVSMLSLETAMLTAFGENENPIFRRIMTASTGTAVCAFVLIMAIYMIVHANHEIRQQRKGDKVNGK